MAESRATYDAYLGVEIELPGGEPLRFEPLGFKRALHFTRLLDEAQQTGGEAFYRFLEEFAEGVKTTDGKPLAKLDLTVPEMFEVGRRFLWVNRLAKREAPAGKATNGAGAGSAGTTSSPNTPTPTEDRPIPTSPGPSSSPS